MNMSHPCQIFKNCGNLGKTSGDYISKGIGKVKYEIGDSPQKKLLF
jgi:hypothetical protein